MIPSPSNTSDGNPAKPVEHVRREPGFLNDDRPGRSRHTGSEMETIGIEPMTPCLQSRCSPS